jgi:glycosyltransferase involved in cell wall biosynthesis
MAAIVRGELDVVHPESERLLPRVRFVPLIGIDAISANLWFVIHRPGRYIHALAEALTGGFRRPGGGALKGAAVFWKSAYFARVVEREGIDHVHAHFLHHPATAALAIFRLTGRRFTITVHADDLFVGPALIEQKLSEAAAVVAISDFNRSILERSTSERDRIEVIHCGVDTNQFGFRERTELRRILCVSRLAHPKGQDTLIEALALALPHAPELSLELVGAGTTMPDLLALSRRVGVADRVRFHGALKEPAVREMLAEADMFVLAARECPDGSLQDGRMDGIPVALMEAMASGLPVVSTRVSGIPELVIDRETGLLVEPDRPQELAQAILGLVHDPELARSLARRARDHVDTSFNLNAETTKLAALFERIIAPEPTQRGNHRPTLVEAQ